MKRLLMVVVVTVIAVVTGGGPASAIAYGENVREGKYAFSVLLTMTGLPAEGGGTRDSSCSGALIAPKWVITAGHCFRDESGQEVSRTVAERTTATVGRADLRGRAGVSVEVVGVRQAPKTDVALAELAAPVSGIEPIRLATTRPSPGEVLRLTGFGLTLGGVPASRLQSGLFTVDAVGDTLVEASGRKPRAETSPCPHDSGGPYFRESPEGAVSLVAVVSSGPGCPHPGPDFSARVDTLSGWVAETMESGTADRGYWIYLLFGGLLIVALAVVLRLVRR